MNSICTCGRKMPHCPFCGSINKQPMVDMSQLFTERLKTHVLFYRCRRCGVSYGIATARGEFITDGGTIQCQAQQKSHVASPDIDTATQDIIDAAQLLQSKGWDITRKPPTDAETPSPANDKSQTQDNDELPEGWTRDAEGKIIAPLSMDDLFKAAKMDSNEEKK